MTRHQWNFWKEEELLWRGKDPDKISHSTGYTFNELLNK